MYAKEKRNLFSTYRYFQDTKHQYQRRVIRQMFFLDNQEIC